jgi:uncharacterized repeat protein (TIGR04138 family)
VDETILNLVREDPRYDYYAYEFLCDAVTYTQERLGRVPDENDSPTTNYHVSGAELARGACELAIQEFGMMAPVVFRQWGIQTTDDIGAIVFHLIRAERLSQSDEDDPSDFHDLFDLERVLTEGFALTADGGVER